QRRVARPGRLRDPLDQGGGGGAGQVGRAPPDPGRARGRGDGGAEELSQPPSRRRRRGRGGRRRRPDRRRFAGRLRASAGEAAGEARLMDARNVIVRPVVSEKSYALIAEGKYTFRVNDRAHKT